MHVDYDTDSNFTFKLLKSEYYLWFNCYFFFSFNGGEALLNDLDCLDIIFYNTFDLRNLKYVYKDISYKEVYDKDDSFFLYNSMYLKEYNLKRNLKLLDKNTFNILNNLDNIKKLNI